MISGQIIINDLGILEGGWLILLSGFESASRLESQTETMLKAFENITKCRSGCPARSRVNCDTFNGDTTDTG